MTTIGKEEQAIRLAHNLFDEWLDITGLVAKHTSYYYELQSLLKDAVRIGMARACDDDKKLKEILIEAKGENK